MSDVLSEAAAGLSRHLNLFSLRLSLGHFRRRRIGHLHFRSEAGAVTTSLRRRVTERRQDVARQEALGEAVVDEPAPVRPHRVLFLDDPDLE